MREGSDRRRVGIEKLAVYPGTMALDMRALASARGLDPEYPVSDLLVAKRTVNPCWEDPVTMAVNVARPMLSDEDLERIELLIVGTESSPDQGKPLSTFVRRHLGVQHNCRNFETKHACYGGTSAAMMAAHWVASGASPGGKALVICTDQGRMHLNTRHEYVMGAGAAALLISDEPEIAEFELEHNGYWTAEVNDTFRPTSREEAGNTESSLYCYLDALEGAYEHFQRRVGEVEFDQYFRKHIYHVPFGGMAKRAHRTALRLRGRVGRQAAEASFERKAEQGLLFTSQVGGTYTASTFYALAGILQSADDLSAGDRVSVFAYGSGSCGEFYSVRVAAGAAERIRAQQLVQQLEHRYELSVDEYERVEAQRTALIDQPTYEVDLSDPGGVFDRHYAGRGRLFLRGLEGFFRDYDWS